MNKINKQNIGIQYIVYGGVWNMKYKILLNKHYIMLT